MSTIESDATGEREPAWEIARLFTLQGRWTDGQYLSFTESLNQLVELVDGHIEVLASPTKSHQKIVNFLLNTILAYFAKAGSGDALAAPYRIRLRNGTLREPDIAVYLAENLSSFGERFGTRPDCVIEVVSDDPASHARDYDDKPPDYAQSGIPEYWIVDPKEAMIAVLEFVQERYQTCGAYHSGEQLKSKLLTELAIDVSSVLAMVPYTEKGTV